MTKHTADWEEEIFDGMSIGRLSQVFRMDRRKVQEKLLGCRTHGQRNGYDVYLLAEAARYLVDPVVDIEEYVKKLKPSDLPASLSDQFWSSQNKRLKFLADSGQLWRTTKVLEVLTTAFRTLRQSILLFADTVENRHGLTDDQRKSLEQMSDGLIEELRRALVDQFEFRGGRDDQETADVVDASHNKQEETDDIGIGL